MRTIMATLVLVLLATTAESGCFDGYGCTDETDFSRDALRFESCDYLWYMRNSIYDDHGYCFKTKRAQSVFDNTGCYVRDSAQIPFNRFEQNNISRIRQIEKQLGCN